MKRVYFKSALISLLLMMITCHARAETGERQKVVGYFPVWAKSYTPDWECLTHLCLAFGFVQTNGDMDVQAVAQNRSIITEAHRHKVKVLLSIGGGGSRNFSAALLNAGCQVKLIHNLKMIVDTLQLDGIDVDYEEWEGGMKGASELDGKKRAALETFYKDLRMVLGNKLITAAVGAGWDTGGFGTYNCYNNTMHQYLDFVNLMIYDQTGPWSGTRIGPHSDWNFFMKAIHHWQVNRKLPLEKLVAGVPFYGYKFSTKQTAIDAEAIPYKKILEMYPDRNAHLKDSIGLLYYDGMQTIKRKAEYVKKNRLGGIMIWEITQNTEEAEKDLLRLINQCLK